MPQKRKTAFYRFSTVSWIPSKVEVKLQIIQSERSEALPRPRPGCRENTSLGSLKDCAKFRRNRSGLANAKLKPASARRG